MLRLFDSTCSTATSICCFSQTQNIFRSNMNCGRNNPEGHPRRVRNSLRSVLPGEYPWRAWIYSNKNGNVPLCAAVYISSDNRALLTPASCVYGHLAEDLRVSFTKDFEESYDVRKVIPHAYYLKETHYYDIAIVALSYEVTLPRWVKQVCLPEVAANYATPCITVSSDDNYSNAIIPQQSNCAVDGVPLDTSFLCTVSPINDYDPEIGGGLMCPEVVVHNLHHTIYGITLYKSGNSSIAVHTNVTYFKDWIHKNLSDLS
ncbi:transmembrane protease serine 11A-like isoform X2 [Melitaea cinxia]|uniref:transmembrane protease serine 11A-like isoform X2 n=1 Tax=Melitaea cinxia TaxID=113334 RepID=UPI001E271D2C|nr:transmembrane protease serine 11A-like isoform X2 [Melitaea cinxia]